MKYRALFINSGGNVSRYTVGRGGGRFPADMVCPLSHHLCHVRCAFMDISKRLFATCMLTKVTFGYVVGDVTGATKAGTTTDWDIVDADGMVTIYVSHEDLLNDEIKPKRNCPALAHEEDE